MRNIHSISGRLVIAIALIAAAACSVLGVLAVFQHGKITTLALREQMDLQYHSVIASFEGEERKAAAVSAVLSKIPALRQALVEEDRTALATLLLDGLAAAKAHGVDLETFTKPPGIVVFRSHTPKVFGDDVTARRRMIAQVYQTGKPVTGIEQGLGNVSIFGSVPVVIDGKVVGIVDTGVQFGPAFVERIKQQFRVDFAVHQITPTGITTLGASFEQKTLATAEELTAAAAGQNIMRRAQLAGQPVEIYLGQLRNFAGEPIAVVELVKNISNFVESENSTRLWLVASTVLVLAFAITAALLVARGMSRPILALRATMGQLAAGQIEVTIPGRGRQDELGAMAEAVAVFKDGMAEADRLRRQQETDRLAAEGERRRLATSLADAFEANVRGVVDAVSTAAEDMKTTAQSMTVTAEHTRAQAMTVGSASHQASANVQTVASAAEELSASIAEIGRQSSESARIAREVAEDGRQTDSLVSGLAIAAQRVGEVVGMIKAVASQTNLLALNASIEAARAGDAGKGFAVVANEVKSLAGQTAKATEEIQSQIGDIQAQTEQAVAAIRSISSRVGDFSGITTAVSSAVEEQGAATQEIARNVQQAAAGTNQVSRTIASVSDAAGETGSAAAKVLASATGMAQQAARLQQEVDRFVSGIRQG